MFKKIQKFNLLYNRQNTEKYSVLFSEISLSFLFFCQEWLIRVHTVNFIFHCAWKMEN